jgi:alpha-tubulin suppressor-like RCC1 family protein
MAQVNLGKIAFTYKAGYSAGTVYQRQDVVIYHGDSYVCLVDGTTGVTPADNHVTWELFAQGTGNISNSGGEIIYNNGTQLVALPAGTTGQVLTVDAGGLPVWATPDVRSGVKARRLIDNQEHGSTLSYRRGGCVMNDDSLRLFGNNENYMLGDGTTNNRSNPSRPGFPPGFPGVSQFYQSYNSASYAIDKTGKLWAWGYNGYGQLGIGDTTDRKIPNNISLVATGSLFGKTVTDLALAGGVEGYQSVLALCSDGTVHAAGYNGYGQLGQGNTNAYNVFVQVPIISNVVSLRMGRERYTACYAVQADGKLYSWGYNGDNQLGDGTTTTATIPIQRTNGSLTGKTITKVFASYQQAFALASDGTLHGWGLNTTYGSLGSGDFLTKTTPVQVNTNVVDLYSNGYDYPLTIVKKTDGTIWAAGSGNYGANGSATSSHSGSWIQIPVVGTVTKVRIGGTGSYNYCMALMTNGNVYAWGYNGNGQLGLGHYDTVLGSVPKLVPIHIRTVTDIAFQGTSSEGGVLFLMDDGQLFATGYGGNSALTEFNGYNFSVATPVIF